MCGPWPRRSVDPCRACGLLFHHIPAFIMVPRSHLGIFGNYCSWNCAKRDLLRLRTRQWFSLMAITAIRTGATLPIRISDHNKSCIPLKIPPALDNLIYVSNVHIGPPPLLLPTISENDEEPPAFQDILPMITSSQTASHHLTRGCSRAPHTVPSPLSAANRNRHPPYNTTT